MMKKAKYLALGYLGFQPLSVTRNFRRVVKELADVKLLVIRADMRKLKLCRDFDYVFAAGPLASRLELPLVDFILPDAAAFQAGHDRRIPFARIFARGLSLNWF